jgi:hypothetical protein
LKIFLKTTVSEVLEKRFKVVVSCSKIFLMNTFEQKQLNVSFSKIRLDDLDLT